MITDQRVKSFLKVQAIPLIPFHNSISFPGEKKTEFNYFTKLNYLVHADAKYKI